MGKNRPDNRSGEKLKKALRQWHLPFLNAVQVSLEEDEDHYELESELKLTRKPLRIDAFVLKLEDAHGEGIAVCILIQSRLASDKFLWLKNLSDCVKAEDFALMAEQAHREPMNRRKDELFQFIGENNEQLWKGDLAMCKIFEEIEQRGEERLANLIQFLLREHRYEEIALVSRDSGKRQEFYQRYGI